MSHIYFGQDSLENEEMFQLLDIALSLSLGFIGLYSLSAVTLALLR